jgi:hypothetical protein
MSGGRLASIHAWWPVLAVPVWLLLGGAVEWSHMAPLALGAYALATAGVALAIAWSLGWRSGRWREQLGVLAVAALLTACTVSAFTAVMGPFTSFRGFDHDPLRLLMVLTVGTFVVLATLDLLRALRSTPARSGGLRVSSGTWLLLLPVLLGVWPGPMVFWPHHSRVLLAFSIDCGAAIALLASIHGRIEGMRGARLRLLVVALCLPPLHLGLITGLSRALPLDGFVPIGLMWVTFGAALLAGHVLLYWLATRIGTGSRVVAHGNQPVAR